MFRLTSDGSKGGGGATGTPLKLDQLCVFFIQFCIRMLKNKAQIARESIKTTLELPGPLNGPWTPAESEFGSALVMCVQADNLLRPPKWKSWIHPCFNTNLNTDICWFIEDYQPWHGSISTLTDDMSWYFRGRTLYKVEQQGKSWKVLSWTLTKIIISWYIRMLKVEPRRNEGKRKATILVSAASCDVCDMSISPVNTIVLISPSTIQFLGYN